MLNALKPGVSPRAGGAKPPCECHQSHHNEGAPLPATSWLPQLLISGTLVLHPQATAYAWKVGWSVSSPTTLKGLSFSLPFLMWMLPFGPYFCSLRRAIFHSFIHPSFNMNES